MIIISIFQIVSIHRLFPSTLKDNAYFCAHILHITQGMVKRHALTRLDIEATYYATKYTTNCKHEPAADVTHTKQVQDTQMFHLAEG